MGSHWQDAHCTWGRWRATAGRPYDCPLGQNTQSSPEISVGGVYVIFSDTVLPAVWLALRTLTRAASCWTMASR